MQFVPLFKQKNKACWVKVWGRGRKTQETFSGRKQVSEKEDNEGGGKVGKMASNHSPLFFPP